MKSPRIGLIGDYHPGVWAHTAVDKAVCLAAKHASRELWRHILHKSPSYQHAPNCFNLLPVNRAIATTIEAVGNAIGENEELIWAERATVAPDRKRTATTVCWWWQSTSDRGAGDGVDRGHTAAEVGGGADLKFTADHA